MNEEEIKAVHKFFAAMQNRLIEKEDTYTSWQGDTVDSAELYGKLRDKLDHLNPGEFARPFWKMKALVDIANFCMMLYDKMEVSTASREVLARPMDINPEDVLEGEWLAPALANKFVDDDLTHVLIEGELLKAQFIGTDHDGNFLVRIAESRRQKNG